MEPQSLLDQAIEHPLMKGLQLFALGGLDQAEGDHSLHIRGEDRIVVDNGDDPVGQGAFRDLGSRDSGRQQQNSERQPETGRHQRAC